MEEKLQFGKCNICGNIVDKSSKFYNIVKTEEMIVNSRHKNY